MYEIIILASLISRQAIVKFINQKYHVEMKTANENTIKTLKKMIHEKTIVQVKGNVGSGSFRIRKEGEKDKRGRGRPRVLKKEEGKQRIQQTASRILTNINRESESEW